MKIDVLGLVTQVAELSRQGSAAQTRSREMAAAATANGSDTTNAIAAYHMFKSGMLALQALYQTLEMQNLPFSYLAGKTDEEIRKFRQVWQGAESVALRDAMKVPGLHLSDCMEGAAVAVKTQLPLIRSSFQNAYKLLDAMVVDAALA